MINKTLIRSAEIELQRVLSQEQKLLKQKYTIDDRISTLRQQAEALKNTLKLFKA